MKRDFIHSSKKRFSSDMESKLSMNPMTLPLVTKEAAVQALIYDMERELDADCRVRVLVKEGIWQVPPERRPANWERLGVGEPQEDGKNSSDGLITPMVTE